MSFSLRAARMVPRFTIVAKQSQAVRAFTSSSTRPLKEGDVNNPHDDKEKHKQDQLAKQKEGKGHWKPELASNSEEAVAADRHEHDDHSAEGIKNLQNKTANNAEEKHK